MSLNVTYHGDIKYCVALKNCNIFSVVVRAILKAESLEGDDPNFMKALPPLLSIDIFQCLFGQFVFEELVIFDSSLRSLFEIAKCALRLLHLSKIWREQWMGELTASYKLNEPVKFEK